MSLIPLLEGLMPPDSFRIVGDEFFLLESSFSRPSFTLVFLFFSRQVRVCARFCPVSDISRSDHTIVLITTHGLHAYFRDILVFSYLFLAGNQTFSEFLVCPLFLLKLFFFFG